MLVEIVISPFLHYSLPNPVKKKSLKVYVLYFIYLMAAIKFRPPGVEDIIMRARLEILLKGERGGQRREKEVKPSQMIFEA